MLSIIDINFCPVVGGVVGGVAGELGCWVVAVILLLAAVQLRKHLKERVDLSGLVLLVVIHP